MDIASCIYNGDKKNAKMEFFQLSDDLQGRFLKGMQQLNKVPFDDVRESMQVLIALANELVQKGEGCPLGEIDEYFSDLAYVLDEEEKDPDNFSLRSIKVSWRINAKRLFGICHEIKTPSDDEQLSSL